VSVNRKMLFVFVTILLIVSVVGNIYLYNQNKLNDQRLMQLSTQLSQPLSSWSFIADLKVADDAIIPRSTVFEKGWRISLTDNAVGKYYLQKLDGDFGPDVIDINQNGPFKKTQLDINTTFKSPKVPGNYIVRYNLIDPDGSKVPGPGTIYVKIVVQ